MNQQWMGAVLVVMFLIGAGCTSSSPSTGRVTQPSLNAECETSGLTGERYDVQEAWLSLYFAAREGDFDLMQMRLWNPQTESEGANMIPTVLDGSCEIDWERSVIGGGSVNLVATDGRDLGTWIQDRDDWFLERVFWEE